VDKTHLSFGRLLHLGVQFVFLRHLPYSNKSFRSNFPSRNARNDAESSIPLYVCQELVVRILVLVMLRFHNWFIISAELGQWVFLRGTRATCKLDKMLPTVGLQISHPIAPGLTPAACITSVKVRNFLTFMTLNRSARGIEKCGQRLLFNTCPAFFISALNMFVT